MPAHLHSLYVCTTEKCQASDHNSAAILGSALGKRAIDPVASSTPYPSLSCRAFRAGDNDMAVRRYTAALAVEPPPLPAIAALLHSNRGGAHHGMGAIADALADCGRACALDPTYGKASLQLRICITGASFLCYHMGQDKRRPCIRCTHPSSGPCNLLALFSWPHEAACSLSA